jgi:hypothetical protein
MPQPEIVSYIKQCREKKIPDETIKKQLLAAGWKEADISEALLSGKQSVTEALWQGADETKARVPRQSRGKLALSIVAGVVLLAGMGAWYYFMFSGRLDVSDKKKAEPAAIEEQPSGTIDSSLSDNPEWKQYTNALGGYVLRYPGDFYSPVDEHGSAEKLTEASPFMLLQKINNSQIGLFVSVVTQTTYPDLDTFKQYLKGLEEKNPGVITVKEDITVNEKKGVQVMECASGGECRESYFTVNRGYQIKIGTIGKLDITKLPASVAAIIATLKFND